MVTATAPVSVVGLVARLFDELPEPMSPKTAQTLLKLDFSKNDARRMKLLNEKANDGKLTAQEREELQVYADAGLLLALLRSKALRVLKSRKQAV